MVGGNLGQQPGQTLGEAQADKLGLTGAARESLINTYQQTLAGVGGAVAGLAASGATGQNGVAALAGMSQGAGTATAVDVFNRQLHPKEVQTIQAKSNDFAKILFGTEKPTDQQTAQAQSYLVYAALADVDRGDQQANMLLGLNRDDKYIAAKQYLSTQNATFVNEAGQVQQVFTTKGNEFYDPLKYSGNNNNQAYRDFYWNSVGINLPLTSTASATDKQLYAQREQERIIRDVKNALPGLLTGAVLTGVGMIPARGTAAASGPVAATAETRRKPAHRRREVRYARRPNCLP